MDEALRESEERFRRVFEEGPLGLALVGKDYHFVKVNSALCQMVGYSGSVTPPNDHSPTSPTRMTCKRMWSLPSGFSEAKYLSIHCESGM